jgi:hypothetical protein
MCAALRRDSLAVPEAKESSGKATPESDRTAAPSPAGAEQPAGVPALELAS